MTLRDLEPGDRVWWLEGGRGARREGVIKRLSDPPRWATVVSPGEHSPHIEYFTLVWAQSLRKVQP